MILNYNLVLNSKVILLIWIFNAIDANAIKMYNIDKTVSKDKHVVQENDNYEIGQPEDVEIESCVSYDYDILVNEYNNDDKEVNGTNSNANNNDDEETSSRISIRGSLYDIWSQRQRTIVTRLWKIIKVWFIIYLVVAVPLWCTRGWCCCCLFCEFFKPTQTIEEAKRFQEANPPGVLQDKKGGVIFYEPTSNERECYEKFEHLIRTI